MQTVSTGEGIAYGIHLIGYLVGLGIVTYLSGMLTIVFVMDEKFFQALLIGVVGALVLAAGLLGMIYKVVSDGVQNGVLKAKGA